MYPDSEDVVEFRASLLNKLPTCPFMATKELITLMLTGGAAQSTPLFAAAIVDRSDLLQMLVSAVPLAYGDRTGHVNEQSGGLTALHGAAKFGCIKSARMLISIGADVNAVAGTGVGAEHGGTTPIHAAALEGNLPMVQLLLDCGARVNSPTPTWNTPLYAASMSCDVFNIFPQFLEVSIILLDAGAEIDAGHTPTSHLITPLARAVMRTDHTMMTLFLERGARVDLAIKALNEDGQRVLSQLAAQLKRHHKKHSGEPVSACPFACAKALLAMEEAVRVRSENRAAARQERKQKKAFMAATSSSAPSAPSPSAPISIPVSKLARTSHGSNRDLDWDDDCIVCHHRLRQCMTLPCSHTVMCMICAQRLRADCAAAHKHTCCPVCSAHTTCLVDMR